MGSLVELYNVWQIQLIVLLSFILQVFLFFTGRLRQGSTNGLLRGSIWLAYLGADMVAIYALGYLSRHQDNGTMETQPLVFFWSPFLLIHLGGQDTITAFSMEDNKLWMRHLLNMVLEATLLRTKSGILVRFISQLSTVVALVIFAVMGAKKQAASRFYGKADIVITYILFIGGIMLEICAIFTVLMASPWTWLWLENQRYRRLAQISWSLVRLPVRRPLWSGKIGQYSFVNYIGLNDESTFSQRVMSLMRKTATAISVKEVRNKVFWVSKRLDCTYETVDDKLMECVLREILAIKAEHNRRDRYYQQPRQWPHMKQLLQRIGDYFVTDFLYAICELHTATEVILASTSADQMKSYSADAIAAAQMCRKLSNYMMYLITAHPDSASLLQVASVKPLKYVLDMLSTADITTTSSRKKNKDEILRETEVRLKGTFGSYYRFFPWSMEQREKVIKELAGIWARLLIYAAGKSRPELHLAQLARGGELLTFVWLFMAKEDLGDVTFNRFEAIGSSEPDGGPPINLKAKYAFHV
uniref:DUF4220 domain-containing protein n=1 Tax=Leersia perrieri TaxID=77586 RepID=A0A0D9X2L6_9ORYZ